MFRQIAARSPLCFGVLAASSGEQRSLWVDTSLLLEQVETHHLKFRPLSASFSALSFDGTATSDHVNGRHTVHVFD